MNAERERRSLSLGVYGSGQLNTVSSGPTRTLTQNLAYTSDVQKTLQKGK